VSVIDWKYYMNNTGCIKYFTRNMNNWQRKLLVLGAGFLMIGVVGAQTAVLREADLREVERQANNDVEIMRQAGDHFVEISPGIVRDKRTNLEWMRCSIGQDWNELTQYCDGKATSYTFKGAQAIARRLNQAGGYNSRIDWRVPKKEELASLIFCSKGYTGGYTSKNIRPGFGSCADGSLRPTIAQAVFPGTSRDFYWSSSSYEESSQWGWYVNFDFGATMPNILGFEDFNHVRLVRNSP